MDTSNRIKEVVVTADDFGLSEEINQGIIESHRDGIVTAASLLVNAPATAQAVELARQHPTLQVGLHLSLVEGLSLRGRRCSITDDEPYFGGGPCLHRNWRTFLARLLTGRIRLPEVAEELSLQMLAFEHLRGRIPFANSTQHLHLFPGLAKLVLSLAKRHGIPVLRLPHRFRDAGNRSRAVQSLLLQAWSSRARATASRAGITAPDTCLGFASSGRLDEATLIALLASAPRGITELITHPGRDCPSLRAQLPTNYARFDWEIERRALMSPRVRAVVRDAGLRLVHFPAPGDDRGIGP